MASSKRSSALVGRSPVYYGWVVLGISTLGMAATLPGQTVGVSLFIDAFIEDLGLSRSAVSWFYTPIPLVLALAALVAWAAAWDAGVVETESVGEGENRGES